MICVRPDKGIPRRVTRDTRWHLTIVNCDNSLQFASDKKSQQSNGRKREGERDECNFVLEIKINQK